MSAYLTCPAICAHLGISRWTWRRWVVSGYAPQPVTELPGHPRWRVADLERFEHGGKRFFVSHRGSSLTEVSR